MRHNDHSIMLVASSLYSATAILRSINKVRISNNVCHLSDITSADGRSLNAMIFARQQFTRPRNKYTWPCKHHITTTDYTRWRTFVQTVYSMDSLKLPTPLDNWVSTSTICFQTWDWFLSGDHKFLYNYNGTVWNRHLICRHSH